MLYPPRNCILHVNTVFRQKWRGHNVFGNWPTTVLPVLGRVSSHTHTTVLRLANRGINLHLLPCGRRRFLVCDIIATSVLRCDILGVDRIRESGCCIPEVIVQDDTSGDLGGFVLRFGGWAYVYVSGWEVHHVLCKLGGLGLSALWLRGGNGAGNPPRCSSR